LTPTRPNYPRARRLALLSAICVAAAAALIPVIPAVFGVPVRQVHVIWGSVSATVRADLEAQFALKEPADLGGGRWSYVPGDTRPSTLRRLATHAAVVATDGIDPNTFEQAASAPLTERRGGMVAMRRGAAAVRALQALLLTSGVILLIAAAFAATGTGPRDVADRLAWSLRRAATHAADVRTRIVPALWTSFTRRRSLASIAARAIAFAQRGVPIASAEAAGLFRIVFGAAVVTYVTADTVTSETISSYDLEAAAGFYESVMRWLDARPALVDELGRISWLLGLLFVVGIATPITFTLFVGAVLLWGSTRALGASHHVMSALLVTLVGLIPVRWGDALSVDAWAFRRIGRRLSRPPSRHYGFAIWLPAFVFGMAFAAAAWSKLREGTAWILNGTVKYHFVSDSDQALVSWGLTLVDNHALAVALSGGAVAIELLVITSAFSRSAAYRVLCAGLALSLLCGFALFQGVVWPAWWVLLLGFLPWHWYRAPSIAVEPRRLGAIHLAIIGVVLVQQLYASWERVEARPIMSAYDMYSTTYADAAAYEESTNLVFRVIGVSPAGALDLPDCTLDSAAAEVFARAAEGDAQSRASMRSLIGGCVRDHPEVQEVRIEGDKRVFDWEEKRFVWKRGLERQGPVDASWLRR
jgi:hypothetical protein